MIELTIFTMRFIKKSEALRTSYNSEHDEYHRQRKKYCVIQLLDLWSSFSRNIILQSSVGRCQTRSGRILLATSIRSIQDAESIARTNSKGKLGGEPRWHDARTAIKAITVLKPANSNEIISALAVVDSPANPLRIARNHFAHESSIDCWNKFSDLKWSTQYNGQGIWKYLDQPQIGGRTRFDQWIDDLQSIASAAAN